MLKVSPAKVKNAGVDIRQDGVPRSALQLLADRNVPDDVVWELFPDAAQFEPSIIEQCRIESLYASLIDRQKSEFERLRSQESAKLPVNFDYSTVSGLSIEMQEKLNAAKPDTLGRASRISGITPAALVILYGLVVRRNSGKEVA